MCYPRGDPSGPIPGPRKTEPPTHPPMFAPLPTPTTEDGSERRIGVEIEFGGLDRDAAAACVRAEFGGSLHDAGALETEIRDTGIGTFRVYLDTALRKYADTPLKKAGLELGSAVIPVEIVTPPLPPAALPTLEKLRARLRARGATGSRDGLFLGFGVHFNPEVPALSGTATVHIVTAYALIEDWLRAVNPINLSRRVLPFTDPYPRGFVDDLAAGWPEMDVDALFGLYARHGNTRNRGLDMLPLFAHLDRARFDRLFPRDTATGGRPTFHYRLPDCRIDEADYRLADEWNRWVLVERVAADRAAMAELAEAWAAHRGALLTVRPDWKDRADAILSRHGLSGEARL